MNSAIATESPAHKEPFVWLIWALLGSVIIACAITINLAINSNDGLVSKDYYKQGLGINQSLTAYQTATELQLSAEMRVANDQLTIQVQAENTLPLQDNVNLHWFHPTDAAQDVVLPLMISTASYNDGVYTWHIAMNKLNIVKQWPQQRWYVLLSSSAQQQAAWKIRGTWVANNNRLTLQP